MKTLFLIAVLMLSGCGSQQASSTQDATILPAQIQVQASPSPSPSVSPTPVIESNGQVIANVINTGQWMGQDIATVYIPSVDRYAEVYLSSGVYVGGNVQYSEQNETGTMYADITNYGEIGKNITYSRGNYYLSTSVAPSSLTVQSYCDGGICDNWTIPVDVDNSNGGWVSVQEVQKPFDFTQIAPLNITYQ